MNLSYDRILITLGAWLLAAMWFLPLAYAVWTAFHPAAYETRFELFAPLTLENFAKAWAQAPFARYFLNTTMLVVMILGAQIVLASFAAYAFAIYQFRGKGILFGLVLVQLMIMPDILLVENYTTMRQLGLVDTIFAIGLPYMGSAFAIFLLRQTFMTIPQELNEAAKIEGAGTLTVLWRVYVPLAKPTYLAFGLVSVSAHWNNFLWPLIITNSVETRPLTVGLSVFAATDSGVEWSVINAATLLTSAPLLLGFLLFQRQFVQSFMRAGIK
ncbi:MAG: carbohydrate ABC transporter permease [Rhodobacteraceae bacterium]|nr:carbohydrate ABC transporter permease [Paracoccaceae bacterium]